MTTPHRPTPGTRRSVLTRGPSYAENVKKGPLLLFSVPVLLIALWWFGSAGSDNLFFPPLSRIVDAAGEVWTWSRLWETLVPSLGRLGAGYAIACVAGVALGLAVGQSRRLALAAAPVLEFFRAVPPPVLVPVLMIFLGIGDVMRVTLVAVGCLWPVLLNTVDGVRSVDTVMRDSARSFGLRGVARLRHLVLPWAAPRISAGMYQALGIGIVMMVISEMFAARDGIGASVIQFQQTFALPEMWSGVILLGLVGVALSALYRFAEKRVLSWYVSSRR